MWHFRGCHVALSSPVKLLKENKKKHGDQWHIWHFKPCLQNVAWHLNQNNWGSLCYVLGQSCHQIVSTRNFHDLWKKKTIILVIKFHSQNCLKSLDCFEKILFLHREHPLYIGPNRGNILGLDIKIPLPTQYSCQL